MQAVKTFRHINTDQIGSVLVTFLSIAWLCLPHTAWAADKVRIGYSGATVSNAMLWVTEEGKLFQKNGIDPEVLYLQTTLGQTAMIAGLPYTALRDAILVHPTMAEGLRLLLAAEPK